MCCNCSYCSEGDLLGSFFNPPCNNLRPAKSRELRGSVLYQGCDCCKRNGLQDHCPRFECQGNPECMTMPFPSCGPSQYCGGKHLQGNVDRFLRRKSNRKDRFCDLLDQRCREMLNNRCEVLDRRCCDQQKFRIYPQDGADCCFPQACGGGGGFPQSCGGGFPQSCGGGFPQTCGGGGGGFFSPPNTTGFFSPPGGCGCCEPPGGAMMILRQSPMQNSYPEPPRCCGCGW